MIKQKRLKRIIDQIKNSFKGRLLPHHPLKNLSYFRIGGCAQILAEPENIESLLLLINACKKNKIPVTIIGQGSNVLIADQGVTGLVVLMRRFNKITRLSNNRVQIGAGASLPEIIKYLARNNLGGAEFLAGIPGSLGGAAFMNAGLRGQAISDIIESIWIVNAQGRINKLNAKDIDFKYRSSSIQEIKAVITDIVVKLKKQPKSKIVKRIKKYIEMRKLKQPQGLPNAGSVFKNPTSKPAGKLLELAGCKGLRRGKAMFSDKHANFIVNLGGAKASDVRGLMKTGMRRVKKRFKITLEPEIIEIGF